MRATSIRYNAKNGGGCPTERLLRSLCSELKAELNYHGYLTNVVLKGCAIFISNQRSCFRISVKKNGYNARLVKTDSKGYRRVDTPTWDERVHFNSIINNAFDHYSLEANITSGDFTIRSLERGAHHEGEWEDEHAAHCTGFRCAMEDIMSEEEAARWIARQDQEVKT